MHVMHVHAYCCLQSCMGVMFCFWKYICVICLCAQRFGVALVPWGQLQLKKAKFATDFTPIDPQCTCSTCQTYTRAYLHSIVTQEPVAASLLTVHNVAYQVHSVHKLERVLFENCIIQHAQFERSCVMDVFRISM